MAKHGVRILEVAVAEDGRRLDNFLVSKLKKTPKSYIYRIIRTGQVRVNGARARPHRRLSPADRVRVPPMRDASDGDNVSLHQALLDRISNAILYEDADLLVVDKPAGIPVHAGSGLRFGIIDIVRRLRAPDAQIELAHRLDRATSGCLVMAKNYPALRRIQRHFNAPECVKKYSCLVAGNVLQARFEALMRLSTARRDHEKHTLVADDGKPARTSFRRLEQLPEMALLEARIATGRTHQIRVHAQALGHPIAGDDKYGDQAFNRRVRELGLRRMFLHAGEVSIPSMASNRDRRVRAELPTELLKFLDTARCPCD